MRASKNLRVERLDTVNVASYTYVKIHTETLRNSKLTDQCYQPVKPSIGHFQGQV